MLAAASLAAAAGPQGRDVATAGNWELSLEGSHRRCGIALAVEPVGIGRAVRFPAGCRRALPILNRAAAWLIEDAGLRLLDPNGAVVLEFAGRSGADTLVARTPGGETYRLEQKERAEEPPAPAPALGVPQVTPVDPAKAPPFETVPGVYLVDRYTEREVCRMELTNIMLNRSGRFEARLKEGCRDRGLAAFDPVMWRYEAGRLTLTARRGHEVTLISERAGHWRRDPEVGATLILRKLGDR